MDKHLFKFNYTYIWLSIVILFIFSPFVFPVTDSYYYWTWSQKLQLSYLDGPPLIAYLLWITTHIFGNNFFAFNFLSLVEISSSSFLIYKIVKLFATKNEAMLATSLWILYPFATTRFIAISMTLDGLDVLSSLLIIYVTLLWINTKKDSYLYLLGIAIGVGLLAKYNVVIVILGLFLYLLLNKNLRGIFLKYQLYIAFLIALVIFSPVLTWNYSHHWISFNYQLTSHEWVGTLDAINSSAKHGFRGMWFYLTSCFFGVLHIYLLLLLGCYIYARKLRNSNSLRNEFSSNSSSNSKKRSNCNNIIPLNIIKFLIFFIGMFWLIESYNNHVGLNYMLTLSAILAILVAHNLYHLQLFKLSKTLLVLFMLVSVIMLINKSQLHSSALNNYNKYIKSNIIRRGI